MPALSLVVVLRLLRDAISVLASVVSDGSPGSSLLMSGMTLPSSAACSVTTELLRGRFDGGLLPSGDTSVFLGLWLTVSGTAESAASSPEASRDDGWRRSAVEDFLAVEPRVEARLRLAVPEPDDEGEDIWVDKLSVRMSPARSLWGDVQRLALSTWE